jgi:predicted phosphodiesterase
VVRAYRSGYSNDFVAGGHGEALPRVNTVKVVEAENHTIGICHELILKSLGDDVIPGAIGRAFPPEESLPDALQGIFGKPVNIVVFGHTHEAMVETHQGVLFVNPGSPSLVKQNIRLGTVAILEITPESRAARIIDLAALDACGLFVRISPIERGAGFLRARPAAASTRP